MTSPLRATLSLLAARAAGPLAAGAGERCRRVYRDGDEWIAVIDTGRRVDGRVVVRREVLGEVARP